MSVWPDTMAAAPVLTGSDGALVSISIAVDPRYLESLLETLAQVDFPINPQIYHDAAVVYEYLDGRRRTEPCTLVEFPAFASGLDSLRAALEAYGFDSGSVSVAPMLDDLRCEARREPAPAGADYRWRTRCRSARLTRTAPLQ